MSWLSREVDLAVFKLGTRLEHLKRIAERLYRRRKDIFEKTVQACAKKDEVLANIYATECAEIGRILRALIKSQLALEQAILRARTMANLGELTKRLSEVNKILKKSRVELRGILPSVRGLEDINTIVSTTTPEFEEATVSPPADVEAILKEASEIAKQRVLAKFPEAVPAPVAEVESANPTASARAEQDVRDYFKAYGEVDIERCAADLGLPKDLVERVAESL